MEAYRVLSKKSSRTAYDLEISPANSQQPNPYYASPYRQQRDRRFYDSDYENWQQRMHNMHNMNPK